MTGGAGRGERVVLTAVGCGALLFLVAPMLIVALASLDPSDFFTFPPETVSDRWYSEFLGDDSWRSSIVLTLTIAALTGLLSTLIGAFAGIAVARAPTALRRFLYIALIAPLTVPVIVLAISYYGIALDLQLVGSLVGFVLANTLLTAPLVALFVAAAAAGVDPRLEYPRRCRAARVRGGRSHGSRSHSSRRRRSPAARWRSCCRSTRSSCRCSSWLRAARRWR